MNKLLFVIIIILFIYASYRYLSPINSNGISKTSDVISPPINKNEVSYGDSYWEYAFVDKIFPIDMILVQNFSLKLNSAVIMQKYNCKYGINGGFYTVENKPIGLFSLNGNNISPQKSSQIFNGFITVNGNDIDISDNNNYKSDTMMQTGPILINNQKVMELKINNDKLARRMVMGKQKSNQAVILAIFDPETKLSGPYLGDLPEIVDLISAKEKLDITEAVNLDGGRASAFFGENIILNEMDNVGSWWCIK